MTISTERSSPPLLATKLSIPPHRPEIVERTRLIERVSAGLFGKLTLISAPPGFGKTTLVTSWMAREGAARNVAWLSLDEGDNDPGRFLAYVVSALRTIDPEFAPGILNLVQSAFGDDPVLVLTDLINALSLSREQFILVLDDYHVIKNEDIHRAMGYLLDHQPPALHLIMTSREIPPFSLSLLRTRREMTEIREEDLKFSIAEATTFLNDIMGLGLPPEQVAAIEGRTEGWIAGLLLAALSTEGSDDPPALLESFTGEHRYVFDYLAEEVLRRQSPDIQRFLERTSVLERMSADLAYTLTGSGREVLEYLVDANLFTVALDARREWYRYHPMFGEFLSARFRDTDPAGWKEAHRQASVWFRANGFAFEATEHALMSEDSDLLARLLEGFGREFVRRGRISTVTRWLEALPEQIVIERPVLTLLMAWVTMLGRRFQETSYWLEQVDLSRIDDPEKRAGVRAYQAVCEATYARFRVDVDEIIRLSREALELFEELPGADDPNECVALLHLGSALRMRGETRQAVEILTETIERATRGEDRIVELNALSQLTAGYAELGDFHQAERWARETFARESDYAMRRLAMTEAARLAQGEILRSRGEFDEASILLDDAIAVIQSTGDREDLGAQILCLFELARIDIALGDIDAARTRVDDALRRSKYLEFDQMTHWRVEGLRARLFLLAGESGPAESWAGSRDFPSDEPIDYLDERAAITRAWIDVDWGQTDNAGQLLERLTASLTAAGRLGRLAEARALLAIVRHRQGRRDEAEHLIDQVVDFAAQQNAHRYLLETHPDVREMLPAARNRALQSNRDWPQRIDAYLDVAPAGDRLDQSELDEPLTERELEVLGLLGDGITNQEIAERLFVTVGTVKRHTHNIYGKLNVSNRTQAIIRGQELGLLDAASARDG